MDGVLDFTEYFDENYHNIEQTKQTKLEIYGDPYYNNRDKYFESRFGMLYEEYLEKLPDLKKYEREVLKITRKQPLYKLKNIEKRKKDEYWLDHKFSISEGFKNNIPPYIIGNIINLEMLPYKDNISKYVRCSISKEELFKKIK